jgi:hypothetical protein
MKKMKKIKDKNINIFFLPLDDRPCSYKYISEFFYILFNQKKLKNINFFGILIFLN